MLKKLVPVCVVTLIVMMAACTKNVPPIEKPYNAGINITPLPLEMKQNEGNFELTKKTVFVVNDPSLDAVAGFFKSKIKNSTGYTLKVESQKPASNYINLSIVADVPVNDEGYLLDVTNDGVDIKAKTPQGIFYGMQTLLQLLPAEIESPQYINYIAWKIPNVNIKDEPRFPYRGRHLDICRHFADVDYVKRQLDVMAMFKINKLHWHLTEDQGWRIESKKYPKLNTISAQRVEGEGDTYGPYVYTQEQVKEIVAYAKERFIEVIPEIELPGHGVAALTAYPEYSCTGGPFEVRNIWGVSNDVYCAGNDSTIQFLTDIIEEVIPLFESDYFHIGGDECPKARWEKCPKCQERIKSLGLKADKDHSAEEKLQSYVVQSMEKVLLKHNKKMIGWDEILEGGLAPSATVMSWRGEQGGIAAANMGHDVIMTPGGWLYLDYYQGDPKISPVSIGGYTTLEKTYSYDPIPAAIADDKKHHILGAQANNWSEYMYDTYLMDLRTYPRLIALAELTWTPKERKDYKDFERRIDNQLVRLDMHNINYYIPMPEQVTPSCNFVAFTDSATLELKTSRPVKIVYSLYCSDPIQTSAVYEKPLTFTENTVIKVRSVLPSDKMSEVRVITFEKQTPSPAVQKPADEKPGLKAEYYKGLARQVSELDGKNADEVEYVTSPQNSKYHVSGYREIYPEDYVSTVLTGYIDVPEDGVYYFSTEVDQFWLDDKLLISNEGEVKRYSRADKSVALAKGLHPIKIVRLSSTVGGWPAMWNKVTLSVRPEKEAKFVMMDEKFFK